MASTRRSMHKNLRIKGKLPIKTPLFDICPLSSPVPEKVMAGFLRFNLIKNQKHTNNAANNIYGEAKRNMVFIAPLLYSTYLLPCLLPAYFQYMRAPWNNALFFVIVLAVRRQILSDHLSLKDIKSPCPHYA